MNPQRRFITALLLLTGLMSACQSTPTPLAQATPTTDVQAVVQAYTPIPTAEIPKTETPTALPSATQPPPPPATNTAAATLIATQTPIPTTLVPTAIPSATAIAFPTVGNEPTIVMFARLDHYVFERPIERDDSLRDYLSRSYPYGGTQFGQFDVHLGVDFENPRFTPILSAGDGVVFYAGNDLETTYGPKTDYYGNLVIIQHDLISPEGLPVFTLYGHMQAINVVTGQNVSAGEKIGSVGDSGIAIGPHLHFEVRVGDPTDYRNTRNPDLWLKPYRGFGTLAGTLTQTTSDWRGVTIFVRSQTLSRETYTYGGERVNSDGGWGENFTLGDLPEGSYEVIISDRNGRIYFRQSITIEDSKTTWLEIAIDR